MATDTLNIIIQSKARGTGATDAEKKLGKLQKAAKFAVTAFAALKTAQAAVDFIKFGAGVQRQAQALDNLAKAAGSSGDAITRSIQEASDFTIDRMTAMSAASKAMVMDVAQSPEEFERLTKVATALGRAMGQDAAKSIDDFVVAAARQSKQIADNLGLVVSTEDATKKYAVQLGKSADALTDAEKKQAFLNEMLVAGEAKMAILGESTGDAASKIEKLDAAVKDAKAGLAEMAVELLDSAVNVDGLAKGLRGLPETIKQLGTIAEYAISKATGTTDEFEQSIRMAYFSSQEYLDTIKEMPPIHDGWKVAMDGLGSESDKLKLRLDAIAKAESDWIKTATADDYMEDVKNMGWQAEAAMVDLADGINSVSTASTDAATPVAEWEAAMASATEQAQAAAMAQLDLAQRLADATDAQIAQVAIDELKRAMEAGEISFDDYQTAVTETQLAFGLATPESMALTAGLGGLTEALATGELGVHGYNEALTLLIENTQSGIDATNALRDALDQVTNYAPPAGWQGGPGGYQGLQHGTPYWPGGLAMLGERGPELAMLPRGTRVFSNPQTRALTNNFGNNTYNVYDQRAAAILAERERRQQRDALARAM